MIRVAALTPGRNVPSARFRIGQLVAPLRAYGVDIRRYDAPLGSYPPAPAALRPFWALGTLASRLPAIAATHRHDVTLLQREFVSTFSTLEAWTSRPRVLDVDDAVYLLRGGRFIDRIARQSAAVICGNSVLADHFRALAPVHVIPTAVDVDRFAPAESPRDHGGFVIGWSGSSGGFQYVYDIEADLAEVLHRLPDARLRIVADRAPELTHISPDRVEFVRWSPRIEVEAIQGMDVGLMPLRDDPWTRGKCSYKMLLYMACGVPVVVSPVGMNAEVLALGEVGHAAPSRDAWVDAITRLHDDARQRAAFGREGRRVVVEHFSVARVAAQVSTVLRSVAAP